MSTQNGTELSFYKKMGIAGREFIGEQYYSLQDSTQKYLINAGIFKIDDYSDITTSTIQDREAYDFEITIGELYTLYRTGDCPKFSDVRGEEDIAVYVNSTIMNCAKVLENIWLHDAVFLRLAIRALVKQKLAEAYNALPLVKEKKLLSEDAYFLIMLASFVAFSWGAAEFLVSALKYDVEKATYAMIVTVYAVGIIFPATLMYRKKLSVTKEDKAYKAWRELNDLLEDYGLQIGTGARLSLEKIAKDDIDVPLIALDLCALLESKKLGGK